MRGIGFWDSGQRSAVRNCLNRGFSRILRMDADFWGLGLSSVFDRKMRVGESGGFRAQTRKFMLQRSFRSQKERAMNARRMNQNQRYEVLMHFPGYECLMAFPGSSTPQIARLRTKNSRQPSAISFQDARLVRLGRKIILGLGKKGKEHILFCDLYPFLRFCVKGV